MRPEHYPTQTGISDVAEFVATVVGSELDARTRDLTPTGGNFMVSLTDRGTEPIGASDRVELSAPAPKRRRLAVIGSIASFIALGIVAAWAVSGERQPPAAVERAVAGNTPTPVTGFDALELEIRGPKGARVIIDGRLWDELAPTVVTGLAPGPHSVRLELPGKPAIVRRLRLRRGRAEMIDRRGRISAAGTPEVEIVSTPEGAVVRVGQMILGTTPLTTNKLAADARHKIQIELDGYEAEEIQLELAPGETKRIEVTLKAKKSAAHGSRASRGKRRATSASARAPPPPRPVPAADGFLTIETKPWTKVSIDGRARGVTTLFKVPVRPGTHEVRMVNEGAGIDEVRRINIRAGVVTKLKLTLGGK